MCDSSFGCVGYAISNSAHSLAPNRCFVYGTSSIYTPSGWDNYDQPNYEIGQSSGFENVECYRDFPSNNLFLLRHCVTQTSWKKNST